MSKAGEMIPHSANTANTAYAVFALFAPPGGSQNRVVRNARESGLLELLADSPEQICIRFRDLAGIATRIEIINYAARAFKRRLALATASLWTLRRPVPYGFWRSHCLVNPLLQ